MALETLFLDPDRYAAWDRFVGESPQGTVFSLTPFLAAFDRRYSLLAVTEGDRILAGIPLVKGFLGAYSIPLFVKYGGVVFAPLEGSLLRQENRRCELQDTLLDVVSTYRSFEYNFHPSYHNWLPFRWRGFGQTTLYTYRIPREQSTSWLTAAHPRVRRNAKSAAAKGVVCEDIQAADAALYRLLMAPYVRRHIRPPIAERPLLNAISRLTRERLGQTWVARDAQGAAVCAAFVVLDRHTAYLLIHGCASSAPPGANTLLICRIIDHTLGSLRDFDFEGSVIRPIELFYRSFGGRLVPYSRIWRRGPLNALRRSGLGMAKKALGYDI
jgi:hypothetical protein